MKARMKWEWLLPLARYTEYWRRARKLLDRVLRAGALALYRPMLQTQAHVFLMHLLANPDEWEAHLELCIVFLAVLLGFANSFTNFQTDRSADLRDGVWL